MPVKSQAQWRAMQAAAHGKSTRGIPRSVAKEYIKHGKPRRLPERKGR